MSTKKRNATDASGDPVKNPVAQVLVKDAALDKIVICGVGVNPPKKIADGEYLTPEQASELGEMHDIYEPLRALLSERIHHVIAAAGALTLVMAKIEETAPLPTLRDVFEPFVQAEAELIANASLTKPARYTSGTRHPDHVAVLKARAYSDCRVVFLAANERLELRALDRELFTRGSDNTNLRLQGPFLIVGLRRDDNSGHCLLLGDNETKVRLPKDDPRFGWEAIHSVLESPHELVGDATRAAKADEWKPTPDAKIEPALAFSFT